MKKIIQITLISILSLLASVVILNALVISGARPYIISEEKAMGTLQDRDFDAIVVLGAGVRYGKPSPLLAERLNTGIALYREGFSDTIIMSGDSEAPLEYDEVSVMVDYARSQGIPDDALVRDDLGLNTHRTVFRAKEVFGLKKYLLVSQDYHLERGIYLARSFGSETFGVSCDKERFSGQMYRDLREIPARVKDFFIGLFKIKP